MNENTVWSKSAIWWRLASSPAVAGRALRYALGEGALNQLLGPER
jgi:hypothetical protein